MRKGDTGLHISTFKSIFECMKRVAVMGFVLSSSLFPFGGKCAVLGFTLVSGSKGHQVERAAETPS